MMTSGATAAVKRSRLDGSDGASLRPLPRERVDCPDRDGQSGRRGGELHQRASTGTSPARGTSSRRPISRSNPGPVTMTTWPPTPTRRAQGVGQRGRGHDDDELHRRRATRPTTPSPPIALGAGRRRSRRPSTAARTPQMSRPRLPRPRRHDVPTRDRLPELGVPYPVTAASSLVGVRQRRPRPTRYCWTSSSPAIRAAPAAAGVRRGRRRRPPPAGRTTAPVTPTTWHRPRPEPDCFGKPATIRRSAVSGRAHHGHLPAPT